MKAKIYHNPRCSKSRAALGILSERGAEIEIIDYLANPPSRATLRALLRKLGVPASELVRSDEPEYRAAVAAGRAETDDELLDLLAAQPRVLQRPIVEIGDRALVCRPPERVRDLLE
jgi:arsenate reductase (glutaredoxin)